jgi:phosphatidylglycerol lysyltransferase
MSAVPDAVKRDRCTGPDREGGRGRLWLVRLAAFFTLGSGLVNLFSVMADPLDPERATILRRIFSMEFIHLARSLTLLAGLALVISSVNVYKRKRRAYRFVLAMALVSVLFHLTKGLDWEEASCSAGLVTVLLITRRCFTVKSSTPDVRLILMRLALAGTAALLYGVAGFWLLEIKEFGVNFHIGYSFREAILFLTLVGDPGVIPQTRYARWFLESLYMMSFAVIIYSGVQLFRPVVYRFRTHPHEIGAAAEIARRYGRSALDFFKLWPDKSLFFSDSRRTFLAYGVSGNFAVVLGDPVGPDQEIEATAAAFIRTCRENDWGVAFHHVPADYLPVYRRLGFRKLKIGDEAIVDLPEFSLEGPRGRAFRVVVRKIEKLGVHLEEFEPPLPDGVLQQAREVSDEWLRIPGRRERTFTLGTFDPQYIRSTTLFAAMDANGRMLGFTNVIPSYLKGECTTDLMRRRIETPNGIMDYLFIQVFLRQKARGYLRFNLGLAPMSGFQEREQASPEERAVHLFFQHLNFLFSYRGLRQYKAKFATTWEPRYVVYRNPLELPRMALALQKLSEYKEV